MVAIHAPFLLISTVALSLLPSASTTSTPVASAAVSSATKQPHFTYDELYKLLTNFWDNFLYPADVVQAKAINSTILAENVQGRMDATRTFTGRELNTEYLFGLFANLAASPTSISLLGVPLSYEVLKFSANDYISSAATRVMFNSEHFPVQLVLYSIQSQCFYSRVPP